jgi:protein-S-isoprenylcysteine O-methyltransferase Ste14
LATAGIGAWQARRISRTAPKMRVPLTRVIMVAPLFAGMFAYVTEPKWMEWSSFSMPSWARWIGVVLGLLTFPLTYWVLTSFGTNMGEGIGPQHRLITTGPYHWVRHPMYAMDMAVAVSIGLIASNWFILIWAAGLLIAVRFVVIPREEARLIEIFGEAYRQYQRKTGSLLPFVWHA